jgi:hypothetical protein
MAEDPGAALRSRMIRAARRAQSTVAREIVRGGAVGQDRNEDLSGVRATSLDIVRSPL